MNAHFHEVVEIGDHQVYVKVDVYIVEEDILVDAMTGGTSAAVGLTACGDVSGLKTNVIILCH